MIQEIKNCKELIPYLKEKIEDEGIKVGIDEDLKTEEVAVIKIDDYYNDLHLRFPPKSVDFGVVVDSQ